MNRVTDTCIPEMEAMRRIENEVLKEWVRADQANERFFPHQFMYKILLSGDLKKSLPNRPEGQLAVLAAAEKNLPMSGPGWEDSTLGNMYSGHCISGDVEEVVYTGAHGHRVHDGAGGVVHEHNGEDAAGIFPDRGRHRG